jgi:hypothetical protein
MDQTAVELIVRWTARASAATFAAALLLFAAGRRVRRPLARGTRLFAGFIAVHTIHFATVAWLAVVSLGANIRERDGWAVVVTVALLFYTAAFVVLRAWRDAARGRSSPRGLDLSARVGVVVIGAVFLNSYVGRAVHAPVYWLPAAGLGAALALHIVATRGMDASNTTRADH